MQHLHENIKLEMARLKHSKRMIKVGFAIFALCSIVIIGIMFTNIAEKREKETRQEEKINKLSHENINLQKEIIELSNEHKNQMAYLNRRNEILLTEQRSLYQQQREIEQRQQVKRCEPIPQQKQEEIKPNTTFSPQVPSISNIKPIQQNYNQNIPRYTPPKPMQMYPRYSAAKLVSDSKIEVMPDNRLKSNMPIYGRYINKPVITIECGKNEKIYKIINECTGAVFPLDRIYFKESNKKNIINHNMKTHMVECIYDQEHGIMHDCNVKLIEIR